jgi:hypothetical protein
MLLDECVVALTAVSEQLHRAKARAENGMTVRVVEEAALAPDNEMIPTILCSGCWDKAGVENVQGMFPQVFCSRCGRACMGYGADLSEADAQPAEGVAP